MIDASPVFSLPSTRHIVLTCTAWKPGPGLPWETATTRIRAFGIPLEDTPEWEQLDAVAILTREGFGTLRELQASTWFDAWRLVPAPWDPSEDDDRLADVLDELQAEAIEIAEAL